MPIDPCETGDGNPTVCTLYFPESGQQNRLCLDCLPLYLANALAELTQTPLERIVAAYSAAGLDAEIAELDEATTPDLDPDLEPDPTPPTKRRGRSSNGSTAAPTATDAGAPTETDEGATTSPLAE